MDSRAGDQPRDPSLRESIEVGSLLGTGAYARVMHARDKRSGVEYALKVVDKRLAQASGRATDIILEKKMLTTLRHPGIVRLYFTFQDLACLYFGLELVHGGELASLIWDMSSFSLPMAQFYAAELVSVLDYLRAERIVHRDIKPDNLLLTSAGHLKLIDFDAAICVQERLQSAAGHDDDVLALAGTTLYSPPEVHLGTARMGNAFALDLWSLGCLIYEMLTGTAAFQAESESQAIQRILEVDLLFPESFQYSTAQDLIRQLLVAAPELRSGQGPAGVVEIKRHGFFGGHLREFDALLLSSPPSWKHEHSSDDSVDAMYEPPYKSMLRREVTPSSGESFISSDSERIRVKVFSTQL